jgi:hypothetical protein
MAKAATQMGGGVGPSPPGCLGGGCSFRRMLVGKVPQSPAVAAVTLGMPAKKLKGWRRGKRMERGKREAQALPIARVKVVQRTIVSPMVRRMLKGCWHTNANSPPRRAQQRVMPPNPPQQLHPHRHRCYRVGLPPFGSAVPSQSRRFSRGGAAGERKRVSGGERRTWTKLRTLRSRPAPHTALVLPHARSVSTPFLCCRPIPECFFVFVCEICACVFPCRWCPHALSHTQRTSTS